MKKLLTSLFLPCFLLSNLQLEAESASYALSLLSKSYAVSLLNDTFSPGLPHLAVLKRKNNALGYAGTQTSKSIYSGFKDPYTDNNRDYVKLSSQLYGVDLNYTPDWNWGFNFNARTVRAKIEGLEYKQMTGSVDQTLAQFNFAGHYNWAFFYGLGLEKDVYAKSRKNELGQPDITLKHDYTPITVSAGYYSQGLFFGLGVTQFQENESLESKIDPRANYRLSSAVLVPKLGVGWSSGERFLNLYQVSYGLADIPKQKTPKGDLWRGEAREHSVSLEVQAGVFQAGLYLGYKIIEPSPDFSKQESYTANLAAAYAPFTGHFVSLILSATRIEEKYPSIRQNRDYGKPMQTTVSPGAVLSYGWSFL